MTTAKLMFTGPDHRDKQASLNTEYRGYAAWADSEPETASNFNNTFLFLDNLNKYTANCTK
jgi:hypothetical protein